MSPYKVNYSELVTALQNHEQGESNSLLRELLPRLKTYLVAVMDAEPWDAEEAVHQAFTNAYEKIMQDEIHNKKYIYKYLLQACRNEYIRLMQSQSHYSGNSEEILKKRTTPAEQIANLMNEDRQRILKECLQKLPEDSREYITYILKNPEVTTKGLSHRFGMSEANVRVKKSRIISDLSHCVKKNLNR